MIYYSKRQLEAFGEPLGDSVTRKEGGRIIYGGGGSGGGGQAPPTQTTAYNTNVPEYARPYVENMLESTQKQIYTDDMAGFRPYRPYSTNVDNYFAGFSPMQQQAQQATAGLQTPEQFGDATTLAGAAGLGSLGAGQQYARNVTDPSMMQSYMSPYQQSVTDIAKQNAVREAQMAQNAQNLGAARQGTYGGARQTLMQAEREKNLLSNLSNIQAQGSQSAFDRAMQAQQFGSTLGLQGMGQAGQAASTLGQLGGQQLGAQKEIIGLQSQMGKEMQAQEQNKINQAIQDYAIAQQYPFMQLGMMNAMLRGLPMQTQTTQLYQAQPSMLQQGIGLAGAAGTLFGGKAAGGAIKEYREGGVTQAYAPGGRVNQDSEAVNNVQMQLSSMDVNELKAVAAKNPSEQIRQMASELLAQKEIAAAQTQKARISGIAAAGGGLFDTMGYAGGGILAFSNGGDLEDKPVSTLGSLFRPTSEEDKAFAKNYLEQQQRQREIQKELNAPELDVPFYKAIKPSERAIVESKRKNLTNQLSMAQQAQVNPSLAVSRGTPLSQMEAQDKQEGPGVVETPIKKEEKVAAKAGTSDKAGVVTGPKTLTDFFNQQKELGPKGQVGEGFEKFIDEYIGDKDRLSRKERLAMAKGFLEFGSTAGPIGVAAAKGLGTYATGAEAARDAEDKIKFETAKIKGDLDKARRAEQRGDVEGAQKAFDSAANRDNQIKVAQMQLAKSSDFERKYALYAESEKAAGRTPSYEGFVRTTSLQDDTAKMTANRKAVEAFTNAESMQFSGDKQYSALKKAAQKGDEAAVQAFNNYRMQKFKEIYGMMLDPEKAIGGGAGVPQGVVVKKVG